MTNPWLQIPLSDYEAHMALPHVRQAQLLSSIFGSALDTYTPRSIALLGCDGGNGLEQLEGRDLGRVVAVALIRQELDRHGGEEVNTIGDQTLAIFDGAVAAIRCGCAIRDAVHGLGMAVRVGIHAGEVEYDDTTMSGITVFTGSRIMVVAQPGEVLVSSTVKELVAGSGITFTDRGTHTLKQLPGEWRLFAPEANSSTP